MLSGNTANPRVLLMWYGWQGTCDDFADMTGHQMIEECREVAGKTVKGIKCEQSWNLVWKML